MNQQPDQDPLQAAIDAKLADIVAGSATPPPWQEAWTRLQPESTDEDRLAVYQAIRDAGSVPPDAAFYLISWQIDTITLLVVEEALQPYEDRLEAIKQAHGLGEDSSWPPGEAPPEYEAALGQLHDAWDALYAAKLDEFGEVEMARLFRTNRERFEQISEAGRQCFHGPRPAVEDDPEWLDELREDVADCLEADSPMGPLGLRYREEDGFWEVQVYPRPVELVGGRYDGEVVLPGFALDLEQLHSAFDSIEGFSWNALGLQWPEGPHVCIEGTYRGHEVFLQVLAQAPDGEMPGMKLDTTKRPRRRQ